MKHFSYICLFLLAFSSCSLRAVREAQDVVAEADSLWAAGQMYGRDLGDSATLAQAYEQLGNLSVFRFPLSASYAHACYHYGRLLREKDNPVAAMECFINATHTGTRDYHILGRVYSNMGSISHLAGEFPLSYGMYERSADMFLRNGDTINYYYALNDMAFELAEQGKKEETFAIVNKLNGVCNNKHLQSKLLETKAVAYKKTKQYDSTIYYTSQLMECKYYEPTILLNRSQAYSFLGMKDSAVYYARVLLGLTNDLYCVNGALYILTQDDESKDKTAIRKVSADRSDVQKLIEKRKGVLLQASQLLEQDLARKPDWVKWLSIISIVVLLTTGIISGYAWKKRKQEMQGQINSISTQQANNIIVSIKKHIDDNDINHTLHWKNYASMKTEVDLYMGGIVSKLEAYNLNEVEIRFCVLTMLDYSLKQIAETIHYSYPSAIKTLKKRIANKLVTTPPNLKDFLLRLRPKT